MYDAWFAPCSRLQPRECLVPWCIYVPVCHLQIKFAVKRRDITPPAAATVRKGNIFFRTSAKKANYLSRTFSADYIRDEVVKCCSCCSVAVIKRVYPDPKNTAIFIYIIIYINIGINVDFRITYFGTAALQQPQQRVQSDARINYAERQQSRRSQRCNSECRVMLASTMPSASSLDEVNTAATCSKGENALWPHPPPLLWEPLRYRNQSPGVLRR